MTDVTATNPRDVLDTAIDAARLAAPQIIGKDGREWAYVPQGYTLTDITDKQRLPIRAKQLITLDDRTSLTNYANRFRSANSIIIADYDAGTITVSIDWHPANDNVDTGAAGAREHSATLKLRSSEEFTRWNAFAGKLHSQSDFAMFLEENSVDITMPEAASMVEISRDLEATTEQSFKGRTRLENGDLTFLYETETKVPTRFIIPSEITLQIPIYQGEPAEFLRAAFRYRATPNGLTMGIAWRRVEYQRMAHFTAIATQVAEDTGLSLAFGRATA